MEVIGLIAEYNPFHNGHAYQIKKIKELYPDSLIILVLNGYFTERGTLSFMTKKDKVIVSLQEGIDLVVELPFIYGTQAADIFAYQSIKILNELGITKLVFGSESNDLKTLEEIAIKEETKEFNDKVKEFLSLGVNYPTALAKSLDIDFLFLPNDLLAISYIKAIKKINKSIIPVSIKRTNDYHDLDSDNEVISASNIRNRFMKNEDIAKYTKYYNSLIRPDYDIFFKLLKAACLTSKNLNRYLDVDEGIEYRLKKVITKVDNLEHLVLNVKTKRYTYNKINRMLVHILVGLTKEDNQDYDYLRILGFTKKAQKYIKELKKDFSLYRQSPVFKYELIVSQIYDLIMGNNTYEFELSNKPIIKN